LSGDGCPAKMRGSNQTKVRRSVVDGGGGGFVGAVIIVNKTFDY